MFRVVVAVRSGRLVCVGMCDYVWRGEGWTGRHGGGCGWRQGYVATRAGRGRVGGQGACSNIAGATDAFTPRLTELGGRALFEESKSPEYAPAPIATGFTAGMLE